MPKFIEIYFEIFLLFEVTIPNAKIYLSSTVVRIIWDSLTNKVLFTDGSRILHTLLVKHYNDLLDKQSSERSRDEVTYFSVGAVFCIHLVVTLL